MNTFEGLQLVTPQQVQQYEANHGPAVERRRQREVAERLKTIVAPLRSLADQMYWRPSTYRRKLEEGWDVHRTPWRLFAERQEGGVVAARLLLKNWSRPQSVGFDKAKLYTTLCEPDVIDWISTPQVDDPLLKVHFNLSDHSAFLRLDGAEATECPVRISPENAEQCLPMAELLVRQIVTVFGPDTATR